MSLASDLTDDLGEFFDANEFAVSGTLNGRAVSVIFDAPVQVQQLGTGAAVVAASLSATLPSADASEDDIGEELVLASGTTYRVRQVLPDGNGVTVLDLEAV